MTGDPLLVDDVYTVLMPVVDPLTEPAELPLLLSRGVRAVVLGTTPEEYRSRTTSPARQAVETSAWLTEVVQRWSVVAGRQMHVAADLEIDGLARLPALTGRLSLGDDVVAFAEAARSALRATREVGISMVLGPVLDALTGVNPWLDGRASRGDVERMMQHSKILIEQATGVRVLAVPKHFPGYPHFPHDPASEVAEMDAGPAAVEAALIPFRRLLPSAKAVMIGPAPVSALDRGVPAAHSRAVMATLSGTGFRGLVVSDHVGAASTARGLRLGEVCVRALAAGCHLLMTPCDVSVTHAAADVVRAVEQGRLSRSSVGAAAQAVRDSIAWTMSDE